MRVLGLSDYAPDLCDYADSLCRDYAPTNSYDYAEIMLLESDDERVNPYLQPLASMVS